MGQINISSRGMILLIAILFIILMVFIIPQKPTINLERMKGKREERDQISPILVQI